MNVAKILVKQQYINVNFQVWVDDFVWYPINELSEQLGYQL